MIIRSEWGRLAARPYQALERAQGYLKLPNGRALSGRSHDYKRNGTSTLFAALDVLSGQVTAGHYKRRRRIEFLDFMNGVIAAYPGKVILTSSSTTFRPTSPSATAGPGLPPQRPLSLHPDLQLLAQPIRQSGFPSCRAIPSPPPVSPASNSSGPTSMTSSPATRLRAAPFVWTKPVVHHKSLKPRFSDL